MTNNNEVSSHSTETEKKEQRKRRTSADTDVGRKGLTCKISLGYCQQSYHHIISLL